MLTAVDHKAVPELEDDAVGDVQVPAVTAPRAALDADDAVVPFCGQVRQLGTERASGLLHDLAEIRQGRVATVLVAGHRAPSRQVPHGSLGWRVRVVHER
jgi:hypothetical protein